MASKGKYTDAKVFSEINITPLTDIFLVLLIIFMVTTAVTVESAAHVDLPKAEATASDPNQKPKGIIVTLTADHQILVNSTNVTMQQLQGTLHDALDKSSDKIVIFQGDPKVILGDMVHILDVAKSAGAEAIAIAVSSLPQGGGGGGAPGAM